jgi:hypothetical protein
LLVRLQKKRENQALLGSTGAGFNSPLHRDDIKGPEAMNLI